MYGYKMQGSSGDYEDKVIETKAWLWEKDIDIARLLQAYVTIQDNYEPIVYAVDHGRTTAMGNKITSKIIALNMASIRHLLNDYSNEIYINNYNNGNIIQTRNLMWDNITGINTENAEPGNTWLIGYIWKGRYDDADIDTQMIYPSPTFSLGPIVNYNGHLMSQYAVWSMQHIYQMNGALADLPYSDRTVYPNMQYKRSNNYYAMPDPNAHPYKITYKAGGLLEKENRVVIRDYSYAIPSSSRVIIGTLDFSIDLDTSYYIGTLPNMGYYAGYFPEFKLANYELDYVNNENMLAIYPNKYVIDVQDRKSFQINGDNYNFSGFLILTRG